MTTPTRKKKGKRIHPRVRGNGKKAISVNKMNYASQNKLHRVSKALAATIIEL